jgi:hypothetical protein
MDSQFPTIEELTAIKEDALERGRIAEIEAQNAEAKRVGDAKRWANDQLPKCLEKCKVAATKGEDSAIVFDTINNYNYTRSLTRDNPELNLKDDLGLKLYYLTELLYEYGLNPQLKYDHDGVGMKSWHNLIVSGW